MLVVVVSGCSAIGGADPSPTETVTPVPVPSVETASPTPTDRPDCAAPRPGAAPVSTPAPRETPLALPGDGDRIDGAALATRHGQALSNYSFHLRTGSSGEVWSLPDAAAFTYRGTGLGISSPWAYAVGGRLYSLETDNGQLVADERPYESDSPTRERLRRVLIGERWLTSRIGPYNYTVVGTGEHGGVDVRVLRDTVDEPLVVRPSPRAGALLSVNSTLYVDRHGVVRGVRHVERLRYDPDAGLPNETQVSTLTVDQVGTASLHRPASFCVIDPSAIRTAAPNRSEGAVVVDPQVPETTAGKPNASTTTPPSNDG